MATRVLKKNGSPVARRVPICRLRVQAPDHPPEVRDFEDGVLRAGSGQGNDLVLPDSAVSRIHFEIAADADGFRLKDLGSTNGTFVDGYRVLGLYLRPGSRIVVGRTEILFEVLAEEAEIPLFTGESFGPLLGNSPRMREVFTTLARVAQSASTVLIEGESGTGKELIAEALHLASPRAERPLVVFDCASTPANLMESELFGHERGAFTSADKSRPGRLEAADRGTFFLDEIGELPLDLQPKLLRALEQRQVRRLGGDQTRRVDVRILCATNRDLAEEVNRGAFRHDLYYRLAVVRVAVPPLRERTEDIPLLVEHFIRQTTGAERAREIVDNIRPESWYELTRYPWPGNIRELRNAVERTLAFAGTSLPDSIVLAVTPLPRMRPSPPERTPVPKAPREATEAALPDAIPVDLDRPFVEQKAEIVARFEVAYVQGLLARHDGKIARAALAAGLDRMYFKRLMRKHQPGAPKETDDT